jgi:hypothetical protein
MHQAGKYKKSIVYRSVLLRAKVWISEFSLPTLYNREVVSVAEYLNIYGYI